MQLSSFDIEFVECLVFRFTHGLTESLFFLDGSILMSKLEVKTLKFLTDSLHIAETELFGLPLLAQIGKFLSQLFHFGFDIGEPFFRRRFVLIRQLARGEFQLCQLALNFVDFGRHAFQLHRHATGGFIHQINCLVRQEAIGDIAMG